MALHPSAQKVESFARQLDLDIEIVEFAETTRTAQEAAAAIGCDVGQIVKSLIFVVAGRPVVILLSGTNRLDEKKLAGLCETNRKQVRRADAELVKAATGFSIGGVPPFGYKTELKVFVDRDLSQYDVVWAAAGTPFAVFAVSPSKLIEASGGEPADVKA